VDSGVREREKKGEGRESIRETAFIIYIINTPAYPTATTTTVSHPLTTSMSRRGSGGGQDAFNYLGVENVGQGHDHRRHAAG